MTTERSNHAELAEHYYYRSQDSHTAIPDWLPTCAVLSPEARILVLATLVLQKRGKPPTRAELAAALGVDQRSIYRWSAELATANVMTVQRAGRRRVAVFHSPNPDRPITDRPITDHMITDRAIRYQDSDSSDHAAPESGKPMIPDHPISDRPVGVGVDHDSLKKKPTISNNAPLKTPLARWLKQAGMNGARYFDDPALDYETYRAFVLDKRGMGWEWRQIVSTLREAPLEKQAAGDLAAGDLAAGDLAAGDLQQFDSTSRQLQRRVELDRAEAIARASGLADVHGKVRK